MPDDNEALDKRIRNLEAELENERMHPAVKIRLEIDTFSSKADEKRAGDLTERLLRFFSESLGLSPESTSGGSGPKSKADLQVLSFEERRQKNEGVFNRPVFLLELVNASKKMVEDTPIWICQLVIKGLLYDYEDVLLVEIENFRGLEQEMVKMGAEPMSATRLMNAIYRELKKEPGS